MNRMELHFLWLAVFVLSLPGVGGAGQKRPALPLPVLTWNREAVAERKIPLGSGACIAVSGRAAIAGLALDKAGV